MNKRILDTNHLGIKRFFTWILVPTRLVLWIKKTKELCGLVASTVLRCNDCVDYHILQCVSLGLLDDEIIEALNIGLVVGGSIVIPHLRHAIETLDLARMEH